MGIGTEHSVIDYSARTFHFHRQIPLVRRSSHHVLHPVVINKVLGTLWPPSDMIKLLEPRFPRKTNPYLESLRKLLTTSQVVGNDV